MPAISIVIIRKISIVIIRKSTRRGSSSWWRKGLSLFYLHACWMYGWRVRGWLQEFKSKDFDEHDDNCPEKEVPCRVCEGHDDACYFPRKELDAHLADRKVRCIRCERAGRWA